MRSLDQSETSQASCDGASSGCVSMITVAQLLLDGSGSICAVPATCPSGLMRSVDPRISYRAVTASRGKIARAEPAAAPYEQGPKINLEKAISDREAARSRYAAAVSEFTGAYIELSSWGQN